MALEYRTESRHSEEAIKRKLVAQTQKRPKWALLTPARPKPRQMMTFLSQQARPGKG